MAGECDLITLREWNGNMALKDVLHEGVSLSDVDSLLNFASENDIAFDTYEGVLNDLHIIYAGRSIKVGRAKPREYIVCYYEFASAWGNTLHILLTDDWDKVASFIPDDCDADED